MALPIITDPAALVAYKFYRVVTYKNPAGATSGYISINTFGIFETVESTTDLALASAGSIATAESEYSAGVSADKAIDGDPGTTWESASSTFPVWLQVELPVASVARKFIVAETTYPNESPGEFAIYGSNDGTTWTLVVHVTGWDTTKSTLVGDRIIRGRSLCADGTPCPLIDIYNWDTKTFIFSVIPDSQGLWSCNVLDQGDPSYMVVHHGNSGFKPQIDGPVKAYALP